MIQTIQLGQQTVYPPWILIKIKKELKLHQYVWKMSELRLKKSNSQVVVPYLISNSWYYIACLKMGCPMFMRCFRKSRLSFYSRAICTEVPTPFSDNTKRIQMVSKVLPFANLNCASFFRFCRVWILKVDHPLSPSYELPQHKSMVECIGSIHWHIGAPKSRVLNLGDGSVPSFITKPVLWSIHNHT